jgi:hypothetical protein
VDDRPAGDSLAEGRTGIEDLLRPLAAHVHGYESPVCLVRLVDMQRLVRDQVCERIPDVVQERLERLLRKQVVEDIRQPAVGVDVAGGDGRSCPAPHDARIGTNRPALKLGRGFCVSLRYAVARPAVGDADEPLLQPRIILRFVQVDPHLIDGGL